MTKLLASITVLAALAAGARADSCVKTCAANAPRDARGCCTGAAGKPVKPKPKPQVALSCPDGEHASAGHCCRADWEWQDAAKKCVCTAARCREDADKDGVADHDDLCPTQPEDADSFEDADGCPDPDNDKDRIPDVTDKCPTEPENYNGLEDEDGCPDKGRVIVTDTQITIIDNVFFTSKGATLSATAEGVLDVLAATLKGNPDITVQASGHADKAEGAAGLALSQQRADLVRAGLLKRGIPAARVVAVGLGATQPVSKSRSKAGQAKNRRVDFLILKRD